MPLPPPGATPRPRETIREDALSVHPTVVGLPLAPPWRRAAAIAIDGTLVLLLTQAPNVIFGVAAAFVLFRASSKRAPSGGYVRRSLRLGFRFGGAVLLFAIAIATWDRARDSIASGLGESDGLSISVADGDGDFRADGEVGVRVAADLIGFRQASDRERAARTGASAIERLRSEGADDEAIEATMRAIVESAPERTWLGPVLDSLLAVTEPPASAQRTGDRDSLSLAYAAAVEAGDTSAADTLAPLLSRAFSADTAAILAARIDRLEADRAGLRARVASLQEEDENPGFVSRLKSAADDLGLGLGWIGLYFTSTLAPWQGRTPGKRLLGIRVIRLNGKPIGWWVAFERFGGYAAGFATGLLGFAQIFWDRNRQAIHDKITETAVIRA